MSYINDYKSDEDENNQGNCSYNITTMNLLAIDRYHSVGMKFLSKLPSYTSEQSCFQKSYQF